MRRRAAHRAALLIAPRKKARGGGGVEGGFYLWFVWLENGYARGRAPKAKVTEGHVAARDERRWSAQEVRTQLKARVVDYEIDCGAAARPQLAEQRDDGRRVVGEQLRIRVGEDLVEGAGRRRGAGVGGPEAEVHAVAPEGDREEQRRRVAVRHDGPEPLGEHLE